MLVRLLLIVVLGLSLAGCPAIPMKNPWGKKAATGPKKVDPYSIHEPVQDLGFQSFLTRLRKAIANKDIPQIASMMTPDFGFYAGKTPAEDRSGDGVFQYWEENNIWPELQLVVKEKFASIDQYMVAPPQVGYDENYHGYRLGIIQVNGSWKFAYFVADAPSN